MEKKELLLYEAPTISEFISVGFLQTLTARYIAFKVNRKWERYQKRLRRAEFLGRPPH